MEEDTTPEASGQPVQPAESTAPAASATDSPKQDVTPDGTPPAVPSAGPSFVDLAASAAPAAASPPEQPTPVLGTPPVIGAPVTGPLASTPGDPTRPPFVDLAGGGITPPRPPVGAWAWVPPPPEPSAPAGRRSRRPLAVLAAAVVLAAALGTGLGLSFGSSGPAGSQAIPSDTTSPLSGNASVNQIAKVVDPAVVDITTTVASADAASAAGTGMIVTSSGEVLTNNHVVEDATSIHVAIQGRTGSYTATVIGVDPVHDVALLQIKGVSGLPTVSLGDSSSVKLGNTVVAIGNALGLGGSPSVTSGAISGLDRSITASDEATPSSESLSGLLETDAQIQPGDSGGPLVDSSGQVIGMDTAAASSDGSTSIGFAIPINQARTIASNIAKGKAVNGIILGLSPFLGVDVESASAAASNGGFFGGDGGSFGFGFGGGFTGNNTGTTTTLGQFVEAVVTAGPADKAGIVAGDTITSINGTTVTDDSSTLTAALAKLKAGSSASVGIVNTSGVASKVTVQIGAIPK